MYKCLGCNRYFQNKRRSSRLIRKLLDQYIWQRQTCSDLANRYNRSGRWVRMRLDEYKSKPRVKLNVKELIIVADTTFFSRMNGLTVFREPHLKKNIWWRQTVYERTEVYQKGREYLEKSGFIIKAVVLDGRCSIRGVFDDLPVQMCHFHQKQIVKRYLTNKPKLEASCELKEITKILAKTNEEEFSKTLNQWHDQWKEFLKQKTANPLTGRWFYTHKRIRSAYRSLKTNLPYLFTYQKYPDLNIPNTTNSLDGFFNRLKSLIYVHRGLNARRRMRIAIEILKDKNS